MCFPGGSTPSPSVPNINIPTPNGTTAGANGAVPTANQVSASTPLPFSDFGNIPQVQAGLVDTPQTDTPQIDPNAQLTGALTNFENANATALQPQFQAENMALNDNLASRGIFNSGAASYLGNQQAGAENSVLAQADAPLIQGMAGAFNTDLLANQQAGLTTGGENLSAKLTTGAENQQATNAASSENAGFYGTAVGSDEQNYNNWLTQQQTEGNNFGNSLLEGYLGSYAPANPQTLSSIGGAPGAIGAAGAGATAPNFGGAFGQAFSNIPNLSFGGNGSGSGGVTTPATQPLGGGQWGAGDSGQEDVL